MGKGLKKGLKGGEGNGKGEGRDGRDGGCLLQTKFTTTPVSYTHLTLPTILRV